MHRAYLLMLTINRRADRNSFQPTSVTRYQSNKQHTHIWYYIEKLCVDINYCDLMNHSICGGFEHIVFVDLSTNKHKYNIMLLLFQY